MKKHIGLLVFFTAMLFALSLKTYGQNNVIAKELYIAANIPDSLKEDANSVVRFSETDIVVKGPGKKMLKEHDIITVLNERAIAKPKW